MARPTQNISARFSDVKPLWDTALRNNGIVWTCNTENNAIRLNMRLNTYRRALRDQTPNGYVIEDLFVVSRNKNVLAIRRRPMPQGTMTTLDGKTPIQPDDLQHFVEQITREPGEMDPERGPEIETS